MNKDSSEHDSDGDESQRQTETSASKEEGTTDAKPPSEEVQEEETPGSQNPENALEEENQASSQNLIGVDTNNLECSTGATETNAENNTTRDTRINPTTTNNGGIQDHSILDVAVGGIEQTSEPPILIFAW
ncbi:hypothetical protein SEMRO_1327_G263120.1 [Seminavis robusta]|uniref:Uncharacterized protein n=1 Tax=Seminavis robusta TaxID=568900 RepID=A0A9N8HRJ1_9STRA|nr:hypothetical protein SEMRO_1327_G263120.1 [Seminavis robusta]|eukprot:Sro1327_g263120.1 n/a (131) ;mRNA; r:27798-28260